VGKTLVLPLITNQLDLELVCDGIGNITLEPTAKLSATVEFVECFVFVFDEFVVDEIPH
jgi:hypothetical protein